MDQIINWLAENIGLSSNVQARIFESIFVLILLWGLHLLLQRTLIERIRDPRTRYQWRKNLTYVTFVLSIMLVVPIWFQGGFRSLATYFGLLSAGLAIALRDPITNFIGWIFILWHRSFEVGDRIQIGEHTGDVIDQRIFLFSLMEIGNWVDADQSTGRVLHVPNGMIFTDVLANYTKGSDFIWNEIPVLVTFESNWEKARRLLGEIAEENAREILESAEESFRKASRRYLLRYGALSSIVYTSVRDSGVLLTIRYLCEPRNRRGSEHHIWEDILRTFSQHADIEFAYPTRRFYTRQMEGKMSALDQVEKTE